MARRRRHSAVRTAVAAAFLSGPPAVGWASELAWVGPLWLPPPASLKDTTAAADDLPALLILPPGWTTGDAAVVLIGDRDGPEPLRERLAEALLDEGTAVLELDVRVRHSPFAAASRELPVQTHLMLRHLSAAVLALHRDAGAGLVVAVGAGAGGEAALLAAREARATRHLGAGGSRLVASAALGPRRPAFALGAAPAAEQGWPVRAPLLCAALSAAVRAEATRSGEFVAPSERAETERDCLAALLPRLSPNAAGPAGSAALAAAP